jgi:alkylation response protein AidB-like acyl-CoA dehydrogenase
MNTATSTPTSVKGAEWLIRETNPFDTFSPADFNEEQQMVKEMCLQFVEAEVMPVADRIDQLEPGLLPSLMLKAGEQGLLGVAIPEEFGGLGKRFRHLHSRK